MKSFSMGDPETTWNKISTFPVLWETLEWNMGSSYFKYLKRTRFKLIRHFPAQCDQQKWVPGSAHKDPKEGSPQINCPGWNFLFLVFPLLINYQCRNLSWHYLFIEEAFSGRLQLFHYMDFNTGLSNGLSKLSVMLSKELDVSLSLSTLK